MAGKRIDIMDLKQLITLKKQGVSNRKAAQILQLSRNTVNDYMRLLEGLNYSYEGLLALEDRVLKELCAPQSEVSQARYEELASYFDYFLTELKRPGCTLLALWHWYVEKHSGGYAYTQFTRHYNLWANKHRVSGKLNHKAGEKVYVDYTGKKLFFIDKATGEQIETEVFVGILPSSQYTFVEATLSQKREDLIGSIRRSVEYFGGVPQAIVSDNLKSAVSKACKYEPVINKTLKDFALHYGCVIDPARPYSPQDKALVEGAVKLVYQRIFYPLSKITFFSLRELNDAIRELLVEYNNYLFQLTEYSRKELFASAEKNYLRPLPPTSYEIRNYRRAKVQLMGHIFLSEDKHYYSVPHRFIGKHVEVSYTESAVEIFYNHERLCTHKRNYQAGAYSVQQDHMSSTHLAYTQWSLTFFQEKAQYIGPKTVEYITKLILQYSYPEIGYKQAQGIVHLTRLYDKSRIEKACQQMFFAERCSYRTIENVLKNGMDQLDLPLENRNHIPQHQISVVLISTNKLTKPNIFMNNHTTIEKMKQLRLHGMAQVHHAAVQEKMYADYSTDEYTALLVDQEWEVRQHRKIKNLVHRAGFKLHASIRDIDYTSHRNLDKNNLERLLTLEFISQHQNIIITGSTGVGKSYLAQAIGNHACTMLCKTIYYNTARLMELLKTARLDGTYLKLIKRIKRSSLLVLDDFGLAPFDSISRQALMDLIEDRHEQASIILTSQIPVSGWHELIGEGTIADAILDRIVNSSHRITLNGKSLRKKIDNQ